MKEQPFRDERIHAVYVETSTDGVVGGSHHSLYFLLRGMDQSRYRLSVVCYEDSSMRAQYEALGCGVHVLRPPRNFRLIPPLPESLRRLGPVRKKINSLFNFVPAVVWPVIIRLLWLKRNRVELVHLNNSPFSGGDWIVACKLSGLACVGHIRGIRNQLDPFQLYLAKKIDAIICISQAVRKSLLECGCKPENLFLIHNAIDPEELHVTESETDLRIRLGIPESSPVLVMVGNIKPWKGQSVLIEAMATVRSAHPETVVVFVGSVRPKDEPHAAELRARARSLGVDDAVIFAGYTEDVPNYLNVATVVVHASTEPEPFGRVIIEAMAMGKAVVGSAAGGVVEIIEDGTTGRLAPPGDPTRLAEVLVSLLDHPDQMHKLGISAKASVNRNFHTTINVQKTVELYQRFLKRCQS